MDLHYDEHNNQSLRRFEKMLKTNSVYFFDSAEFDRIVKYYIDNGRINLAKKAISLGLEQHPDIIDLRLLKAELLIIEEKYSDWHIVADNAWKYENGVLVSYEVPDPFLKG